MIPAISLPAPLATPLATGLATPLATALASWAALLVVCTSLALPAPLTAQDGEGRALKILPVGDLLFRIQSPRAPRLGSLTRREPHEEEFSSVLAQQEFVCIERGQFLDVVRASAGDMAENVGLNIRNQSLLVTGGAAEVAKIEQIVSTMRSAMTDRFAVQARLYRIENGSTFPARASAAKLVELTQNLALLWEGRSTTLSGQQILLNQEKLTRYVSDIDVEVAEEMSVGRSKTTAMFEGVRLVVESHNLIGSMDRVFKCQFAIGEKERDIELQSTGVRLLPAVGIPHLRAASGSFSGRVTHDGALLVTIQSRAGAGSNLLLVLQAGPAGNASTEVSAGRTLLLPISALTTSSMQHVVPFSAPESDPEGTRGGYPDIEIETDDQHSRGDTLLSLMREGLGSLLEEEGASLDLTQNGSGHGFALIKGSEKLRTEARRLLAAMQDEWIQTVEVELRTDLHPVQRSGSTFSRLQGKANGKGSTLHSITLPCLAGDTAIVLKGYESAVVRDYEPEIANKTTLSNPVVQTTFSGVISSVRATLQGNHASADLLVSIHHVPPATRQATTQETVGDLYHVSVNKAHFRHSGRMALGSVLPLGWGPTIRSQPDDLRMHQVVRFRKL